jgi:hypothetical protein
MRVRDGEVDVAGTKCRAPSLQQAYGPQIIRIVNLNSSQAR